MTNELEMGTTILNPELVKEQMQLQFVHNAKTKPWGWEWKWTWASKLLSQGRSTAHVKKVFGLTIPWMMAHNLIKIDPIKNKKDEIVDWRYVSAA